MSTLNLTPRAPAAVTGFAATSGVRAASLVWDSSGNVTDMYEVWSNTVNTLGTATLTATVQSNNFSLGSISTLTYFWVRVINTIGTPGVFTSSVMYTPQAITSADTANTPATSIGSGVGASSSATTIGSYGVWTSAGYAAFTASDNSVVTLSMALTVDISSVSGTGIQVLVRSRLYDQTVGADVPAGTKTSIIYMNLIAPRGDLSQIFNINESFVSGFRGLINPGHDYRLYAEVMKQRVFGTPTATVDIGSQVTSSGAASI